MLSSDAYEYFFKVRWPDGFVCPRCGHSAYYSIFTRSAPLYQCRRCRQQTSLTAGTVMERSRTSLVKWALAFHAISQGSGLNAKQLALRIAVSHKVAWTMLRRIRDAIGRAEAASKLRGRALLGLMFLGTRNLQPFVPHPQEHAVMLGVTLDRTSDVPVILKLHAVSPEQMVRKQLLPEATLHLANTLAHPEACEIVWLKRFASPLFPKLRQWFLKAADWLYKLFHGLGRKYLQSYLDEYCFRYNVSAAGKDLKQAFLAACLRNNVQDKLRPRQVSSIA